MSVSELGERVLPVIFSAMPLSGCCFYQVDDGNLALNHRLAGLSQRWLSRYYQHFWRFDPLHPAKLGDSHVRIRTLSPGSVRSDSVDNVYLREFLLPQRTPHQAEVYFRHGEAVVAGASLLRSEDHGPFSEQNLVFLESLIDLVEPTFGKRREVRDPALESLTAREKQVYRLMSAGLCNKDIARRLAIEVTTVKTHVTRVLQKTSVSNRTELIVKVREGGHYPDLPS